MSMADATAKAGFVDLVLFDQTLKANAIKAMGRTIVERKTEFEEIMYCKAGLMKVVATAVLELENLRWILLYLL